MKTRILASLALGSFLAASAAFAAASDVTGTIKTIDPAAHTVTLSDGITYTLAADFKAAGFKVGEKVVLSWEMDGTVHKALSMTPAS
ncbi:MAG: DUF1344 domain-containing protein [Paracoccaceae bacterium]|jgi:Cu/Ag efflux protein CusF